MPLITRAGKGSALTHAEMDGNLNYLETFVPVTGGISPKNVTDDIILNENTTLKFDGGEVLGVENSISTGISNYFILVVGDKIYTTNYDEIVKVFDKNTLSLITTYNSVPNYTLAYNPSLDRVYIGSWDTSGTMYYIDNATDTLVPVNNGFTGVTEWIRYSTFDSHVYGYDYISQQIAKFDANLNLVTTAPVLNFNGYDLEIDQTNGDIWLQGRNLSFISENVVFNSSLTETHRFTGTNPIGAEGIGIIGGKVFIGAGQGVGINVYDSTSKSLLTTISNTSFQIFIQSANGKLLYRDVDQFTSNKTLYELDPTTYTSTPLVQGDIFDPSYFYYDGTKYFVTSNNKANVDILSNSTAYSSLQTNTLTANQTLSLPNKSGTVSLLDDLTLSLNGSNLSIAGGNTIALPGGNITYSDITFVDPISGNDGTGIVGRFDKPFQTISGAVNSTSIGSPSARKLVYVRKGVYFASSITLKSYVDVYCEPGVNFQSGGFIDDINTINANVYGYARFTSNSAPIRLTWGTTCYFEFDEIDQVSTIFRGAIETIPNTGYTANLKVKGNRVKTNCHNGYAMTFRASSNVTLDIKHEITAPYHLFFFRVNGAGAKFNGTFTVNCPKINIETGGYLGNDNKTALYALDTQNATFTINGNITNQTTTTSGWATITVYGYGNTNNLTINGNITSGLENAIGLDEGGAGNSTAKVIINGNISSQNRIMIGYRSNEITFNNSYLRKISNASYPNPMFTLIDSGGETPTTFFNKCTIHQEENNQHVVSVNTTSPKTYFYNTLAAVTGTTNYLIFGNGISPNTGTIDTKCNRPLDPAHTELFSVSGFFQEPNLVLPKANI